MQKLQEVQEQRQELLVLLETAKKNVANASTAFNKAPKAKSAEFKTALDVEIAERDAIISKIAEVDILMDEQKNEKTSTDVTTRHDSGSMSNVLNAFDEFENMPNDVLLNNSSEYMDLELGQTYNVLFTGKTKQIPDKVNDKDKAKGLTITAVCGFTKKGGILTPFVNCDAMVTRQVAQWVSDGTITDEKPIFCRLIVAKEKSGDVGKQFKNITFLTASI